MASITIRNLDDDVKTRLRVRAAEHHRSMEEEARIILRDAVTDHHSGPRNLAAFTRECFASVGGRRTRTYLARPDARAPGFLVSGSILVIDTNAASELMRPQPTVAVAAWIAEREAQDMCLTAVSEAELL